MKITDSIKVKYFINKIKLETLKLNEMLPKHIVDNIISILILVNEAQDKVVLKFIIDGNFSVKTTI